MIFLIGGGGYVYDNTKLHNGGAVAARVDERGPKGKRGSAVRTRSFLYAPWKNIFLLCH